MSRNSTTDYQAVVFDLGETLIDLGGKSDRQLFQEATAEVYRHLREKNFKLPSLRKFRSVLWFEYVWRLLWGAARHREVEAMSVTRRALAKMNVKLDPAEFKPIAYEFFDSCSGGFHLFEGVSDFLHRLKQMPVKLGLLSNTVWSGEFMDRALERLGIVDVFDIKVYSADFGCKKPAPGIFKETLKQLGVDPAVSIMVGDSYRKDVVPAKKLGMTTVWYDWTGSSGTKHKKSVDHIINDSEAMMDCVGRLVGLDQTND